MSDHPQTPKKDESFKNERNLIIPELKKLWGGFLSNKVQKEGKFIY